MSTNVNESRLCRIFILAMCVHATGCDAAHGEDHALKLPLRVIADVQLPGDTSRFDYASIDPSRHLLFMAHMGSDEILVFNTEEQKVVHRIPHVSNVHGVLVIPELKRVYASATGTHEIAVIDEDSFAVTARMPAGRYPDGIAFAPEAHKLYVSDETGAAEIVIDIRINQRVAMIPLGGEVGNTQYDPVSTHVFVNVQTRQQLIEIDPAVDKVVARYDLAGADGNHGLLLRPDERIAFIACDGNDKLLVFDLGTHQVKQSFDVGRGPDVLADDRTNGLIYVASESGNVSVFKLESSTVTKLADDILAPNAHVVAVDPTTHKVYFPIKNLGGKPTLRVMEP